MLFLIRSSLDQEFNAWRIRRSANSFSCKWRCCNVSKYRSSQETYKSKDGSKFDVFSSVSLFWDSDASSATILSFGHMTGLFKRFSCVTLFVSGELSRFCDKRDDVTHQRWSSLLLSRSSTILSAPLRRYANNCATSSGGKSAGVQRAKT